MVNGNYYPGVDLIQDPGVVLIQDPGVLRSHTGPRSSSHACIQLDPGEDFIQDSGV